MTCVVKSNNQCQYMEYSIHLITWQTCKIQTLPIHQRTVCINRNDGKRMLLSWIDPKNRTKKKTINNKYTCTGIKSKNKDQISKKDYLLVLLLKCHSHQVKYYWIVLFMRDHPSYKVSFSLQKVWPKEGDYCIHIVLEMKIWIYWSESNSWIYFYIQSNMSIVVTLRRLTKWPLYTGDLYMKGFDYSTKYATLVANK
jgi:hypothetical protein